MKNSNFWYFQESATKSTKKNYQKTPRFLKLTKVTTAQLTPEIRLKRLNKFLRNINF